MATMAEIEEGYPERRAALLAAMGTMSFAEFGEGIAAGLRNVRPAISIGDGWVPVTEASFQLRRISGPSLDPVVFGLPAPGVPGVAGRSALADLGARLVEWARQVIADIGRALRPLFDVLRKYAPVLIAISEARRERVTGMHREYARRQRAREAEALTGG